MKVFIIKEENKEKKFKDLLKAINYAVRKSERFWRKKFNVECKYNGHNEWIDDNSGLVLRLYFDSSDYGERGCFEDIHVYEII